MMLSTTRQAACNEKGDTSRACWWSMQWGQHNMLCTGYKAESKTGSGRQPGHTVRHEKPQWACTYVCAGWHKKVSTLLHSKARRIWHSAKQASGRWVGRVVAAASVVLHTATRVLQPGAAPPRSRPTPHHTDTGTTQHKEATTSQSSSLQCKHHADPQAPLRTGTWGAAVVY